MANVKKENGPKGGGAISGIIIAACIFVGWINNYPISVEEKTYLFEIYSSQDIHYNGTGSFYGFMIA